MKQLLRMKYKWINEQFETIYLNAEEGNQDLMVAVVGIITHCSHKIDMLNASRLLTQAIQFTMIYLECIVTSQVTF